ncbi:YesL family protein [Alteribacillus sp. HJP-4]|uniref:YesL family protein n=1 Tax=Alteribacillus sp. HJP-4 TaxID=2775394 RepID=UPI0035CD3C12
MNQGGLMGGLYSVFEWITRLAYVNLLWFIFTMAGLIVFTFFPATSAMFAVIRKWTMGKTEIPVFKTFWKEFRSEFWKSSLIGAVLVAFAIILYIDFQVFTSFDGLLGTALIALSISIAFLYLIVACFIFPVLAHFKLRFWQYFKQALLLGLSSPAAILSIVITTFILYMLLIRIPALLIFFGGSTFAFIIMWFAMRTFRRLEAKQKQQQEST